MFSVGSYAKIWEIKAINEKYSDIRISTSKKDKATGEYSQDFGGFVRMVGQAHSQMSFLHEGDKFKIVRCGVENTYNKEKKTTYNNFIIFEVELEEAQSSTGAAAADEENPFL